MKQFTCFLLVVFVLLFVGCDMSNNNSEDCGLFPGRVVISNQTDPGVVVETYTKRNNTQMIAFGGEGRHQTACDKLVSFTVRASREGGEGGALTVFDIQTFAVSFDNGPSHNEYYVTLGLMDGRLIAKGPSSELILGFGL